MFNVGQTVFAYWGETGHYYLGTIVAAFENSYHVVFADGDQGAIPADKIQAANMVPGLKVMARWTDGYFYAGTVHEVVGMAVFIHFDDGDQGWTSFAGITIK